MDRLDAAMLMRVFLGWLRGERGHCGMVAITTMDEEDARRPSRERESLVNERSRITNRMKSALARLGIRGFKPHLRKAPERLASPLKSARRRTAVDLWASVLQRQRGRRCNWP
jgi:transposase